MKKTLPLLISLLSFVSFLKVSFSQHEQINFDHISIEDGLSQMTVFSVCQDERGFMWFGTEDGLNRYDGYNFKIYKPDPEDPHSISDNYIYVIVQSRSGNLWIGTRMGGLNKYIPEKDAFVHYKHEPDNPNSLSNNKVYSLYEDSEGIVWLGTYGGGLNRFDPETEIFTRYRYNPDDPNTVGEDYVAAINGDKEGNIWIGCDEGGVTRFNKKTETFTRFYQNPDDPNSLSDNDIFSIYVDEKDVLWLGTYGGGVNRFVPPGNENQSPEIEQFVHQPDKPNTIASNIVFDIYKEKENIIWFGTYRGGLDRYDISQKQFTNYAYNPDNPNSLSSNSIWQIFVDDAGIMWIGTSGGINKFKLGAKKFARIYYQKDNPEALPNSFVWAIYQGSEGYLWFGTSAGLSTYDNQKKKFIKHYQADESNPNSISHNRITAIYEDSRKRFWVGTNGGGLNLFNKENNTFSHFYHHSEDSASLAFNSVNTIIEDKSGTLWVGTKGGLSKMYNDSAGQTKFLNYRADNSLGEKLFSHYINVLCEDKHGNLWIGTEIGFSKLNGTTGKIVNSYKNEPDNNNSLSYNNISTIIEDSQGLLWIGTFGGGLNKFNPETEKFTVYTEKDGLPNNVVYAILEDEQHRLWISTNGGLSKFNIKEETFRNYTEKDGLQSNEFNAGAYCKTQSGKMLFGGVNGANIFHPDKVKDSDYKPQVIITDFKILNRSVAIGDTINKRVVLNKTITETDRITLTHKDYVFSFEFASLHYASPDKIKYAYMLENFDENWNYTDSKHRFATYTNLDQGDYTFKVKATNSDGVWKKTPTTIKIMILPPFWETWWFRALLIIVIVGSALLWYWWRINSIKKQKKELERQVQERTAEIRQKNTALKEQKEQIENAYNNVKMLSEIGKDLTSHLSVEKIVATVYENVNSLMDASVFGIGIFNENSFSIDFSGTKEKGEILPYFSYSLNEENRIAVLCYKNKEEILISEYSKEYKKYISRKTPPKAGESPESIIYLPLLVKDKKIGVLTVQSFEKSAYTDYQLNIVRNIAVYAAIALDNADAYQQIDDRKNEIERQARDLKEANVQLEEQQEEIQQQAEELAAQTDALQATNTALQREREYTMGSIRYAKTIQNAILPTKQQIGHFFDSFIIFKPKDIVSGDFYWMSHISTDDKETETVFFAVVDCTGHGVPGAFMSMIGNRLFNEIVNEKKIYDPKTILTRLDEETKIALNQKETDNNDGMDVCLCRFDMKNDTCKTTFCGAKRYFIYRKHASDEITVLRGDRRSIGGKQLRETSVKFTNQEVTIQKGDTMYLLSDGIIDQNAPDRKRFGTPKLLKLLQEISTKSLTEQNINIEEELNKHQQEEKQRDDITMIGLRLKQA